MPIKHAVDFNRDVVPTVVCVNKSTLDLGVDFDKLVPALQRFLDEVFVPVWGTPAKLVKSKDPKPGCWHLVFLDDADQKGTSSFHDITYSGMPIAKVFVRPAKKSGEVISVTACHELLEMLVDPSAALWTDGPRGTVWAYEVCGVVEDDKIDFNGIQMSDFVYPAYHYFGRFLAARDSQISFSVIHRRSAFGGADHGGHDVELGRRAWTLA